MGMTLITKDTDYAIRALCFLAKTSHEPHSVKELSKGLHISYPFLRKIMQALTKHGFLRSVKGKGGGFTLTRSPQEIFITQIIDLFQGPIQLKNCRIKHLMCPDFQHCLLRENISNIETYAQQVLKSVTIQSLLGG